MIAAKLAAAQAGLGHQVTMFTTDIPSQREQTAAALAGIPGIDQVTMIRTPPPNSLERITGRQAKSQLNPLVDQVDVVHLHSVWESILLAAASAARAHSKPYFVLLNGMLDPWSLAQKAFKKRLAMAIAHRRMLNGAAALHVGNADEQHLIAPLGLATKTVIIPNGVFLEEIADLPPSDAFHAAHPELEGQPYILFLSRLHYKKGLDYLAAAFAIVAKRQAAVRLVVAGPDGGEQAKFEQWIEEAGVADRVHIVGPLYGRDKLAALSGAMCFCLPSRQEGFSVAITEALGCGVPVVITEGCHFPQVAEVGAGIVTPPDPNQVAEALLTILSDVTLRKRMSAAGRDLVRRELNWPAIARKTIAMYEEALNSP